MILVKKHIVCLVFGLIAILLFSCNRGNSKVIPIRTIVELNVGESQQVEISNGQVVTLHLLEITEHRDSLRNALRSADIRMLIDGDEVVLKAGSYCLPVTVDMVQIDCPAIKSIYPNVGRDWWGMTKAARFRLWPKGSPLITPGTFVYPIKQKWFANLTQMSNEPTYVNEGEKQQGYIYYHADLDIGGAEGKDEIVSATDGLVISVHNKTLKEYINDIGGIREDVIYIIDDRGWYYRYSHLHRVDKSIQLGQQIKVGQHLGYIGKEGASGGWVHLHFGIKHKESPSGKWASEDAYAYVYEAYVNQYKPSILAHARPHQLAWVGDEVTLDGSNSESFKGNIVSYDWKFSDGTNKSGAIQSKVYDEPGMYSEILKVKNINGDVDYDFCTVQVFAREGQGTKIPTMQTAFYPTIGTKKGDAISFFVRSFNCEGGNEIWDFGDGTPQVKVNSGNGKNMTSAGSFAEVKHVYRQEGDYIVTTKRTGKNGISAITHLHVKIEE